MLLIFRMNSKKSRSGMIAVSEELSPEDIDRLCQLIELLDHWDKATHAIAPSQQSSPKHNFKMKERNHAKRNLG